MRFLEGVGMGNKYQIAVDSVSPVFGKIAAKIIRKFYNAS